MRRFLLPLLVLFVFSACTDDPPAVSSEGISVLADMQYYPVLEGSQWEYRVDTTANGQTARGVGQIRSMIMGEKDINEVTYAVQVNQVIRAQEVSFDTLYVRKTAQGVLMSSPGLQQLSAIALIPGLPIEDIPTEFLAVPAPGTFQTEWQIFNFVFDQIPLVVVYYRIIGRFRGYQDVVTDQRTFRNCARATISIEAQFPNPDNILVPIRINESADFYYSRPHGLVVVEGSDAIFTLLRGGLPLDLQYNRSRQELISQTIPQPDPFCQ
jgi:hypothetical protein